MIKILDWTAAEANASTTCFDSSKRVWGLGLSMGHCKTEDEILVFL